jgi:hypothetical protein
MPTVFSYTAPSVGHVEQCWYGYNYIFSTVMSVAALGLVGCTVGICGLERSAFLTHVPYIHSESARTNVILLLCKKKNAFRIMPLNFGQTKRYINQLTVTNETKA